MHTPSRSSRVPLAGRRGREGVRTFVAYSGLPVGLVAVSIMLGTYALLDLAPSVPLLLLAFCGTALVYQLERTAGLAPEDAFNQPQRLAWVKRHPYYVWGSSGIALAIGAVAILFLRPATLGVGALLALLSLAYGAPLLPDGRRLKTIWYLKPLVIAGAWALGGTVLPVVEAGATLTRAVYFLLLYRFLFILPNALLADWPDREGDARAGLRTVATQLSGPSLQRLAALPLLLAIAGGTVALVTQRASTLLCVDLVGPVLMLAAVARPLTLSRWYYGTQLDALVGWPLVTAVSAWLFGVG